MVDLKLEKKALIKGINGHLTGSMKYCEADAIKLNGVLCAIEHNLTADPQAPKMKARFIRGSKHHLVFRGCKFAAMLGMSGEASEEEFKCSYDADPNHFMFNSLIHSCRARIVVNAQGILQPGSTFAHYHQVYDEVCFPTLTISF